VKVFGKGQKEREIGIHPNVGKVVWKYINKHWASFKIEDDRLFLSERGALTTSGVEMLFHLVKKRTGITDVRVTPHTMRHTFAKWYLKNGGDLFKLSRELGHSSVQITGNIYLGDFKSTDARQDHDRYSPARGIKLERTKDSKKSDRRKS
jgi:integrase/recombinase XerD